jgi:CRP-like cAMP-binding protein
VSKNEGPLYVPVPLTRQDFADMVGARVETVIRIMSRWQKDGLIGHNEHGLWVRDRATLEALARSE